MSARVVDELERLFPFSSSHATVTCLHAHPSRIACGRAPLRALVPRESPGRGLFLFRAACALERLSTAALSAHLPPLALRIVALGGERRMRRRLAKQISPARQGHDDLALYSLNRKGPKTRNVSKPPLHNTIYGSK